MTKHKNIENTDKHIIEWMYKHMKLSQTDIATVYGCCTGVINNFMRENNISANIYKIPSIKHKKIIDMYINNRSSLNKIADIYGVSSGTISSIMRQHGIQIKSKSEMYSGCGNPFYGRHHTQDVIYNMRIHPCIEPSENLSYILGVIKGDGWVVASKGHYRVGLTVKSEIFRDSFHDSLQKIGLYPFKNITRNLVQSSAKSIEFAQWYKNLSCEDIVDYIRGNEHAFLRGFYESEGCLVKDKRKRDSWKLKITNTDKKLIDIVTEILDKYNLKYHVYLKSNRENYKAQNGKEYPRKDIYNIIIGTKKNINTFLELTKPCIKNKEEYLREHVV